MKSEITGADPHITPDDRDREILNTRTAEWEKRQGPRVGDFVSLADGTLHRFSHDWGDDIQHSKYGSFYFFGSCMSFSGGPEPAILKTLLRDTGEVRLGSAWFFHHNYACAHSAVYVQVPCRVYEYEGTPVIYGAK